MHIATSWFNWFIRTIAILFRDYVLVVTNKVKVIYIVFINAVTTLLPILIQTEPSSLDDNLVANWIK